MSETVYHMNAQEEPQRLEEQSLLRNYSLNVELGDKSCALINGMKVLDADVVQGFSLAI